MGFQQRRTTHAGWPTTAPVVPESPELYAPQPPASGDVQFAHAKQRRAQAASVAALCFTALVLTPELIASTHDTNAVIEAAQAQPRALTQYQQSAAPVFVPAVVVPAPELTPPVYPRWFDRRPARAAYQRGFAWHPVTPAAALSGDVVWTGPSDGAWNFVDGPLDFTTPGTYTLTFSITAQLRVTGAAAGAPGASGRFDSTQSWGGGGGGSGASDATGVVVSVSPAETFTVVVGAGGGPGSRNTSYTGSVQGAVFVMGGGGAATNFTGGTAGVATTGSTNKQHGQAGGNGSIESTATLSTLGGSGATGGGGGGGAGPSGSGTGINNGRAGGTGTSEAGGAGGARGVDGGDTAAATGGEGVGANIYGGGGAGGGLLLPGGDIARGGGGGGGGGANSGPGPGGGGDGSDGILVLAVAVPDGRPTADTGSLYPDRPWQYQQSAAPVYFELTVPPIVEPPIGPSDGPASTIEGAAVGWPRVVQYQAQAGPIVVRSTPLGSATAVYPSRLFRRAYPTSAQLATVLPPPQPEPFGTVSPVYPRSFDRRPALAASMRAVAWAPSTPETYPLGSATAIYPRWFPLRPSFAASMRAFAWGAVTPETYPPGSASAVYPHRLTRRDYRTSDQQVTAADTITPPDIQAPEGAVWPIAPRWFPLRPARAAYMPAFAWSSDTSATYPIGSATAIYPRWFPRPAMLASQQQALGWSTFTPPLFRASESVYPSRTIGRAARAAYTPAFAWHPVTPATVPVVPPSDSGVVFREVAWQYQQVSSPVVIPAETPPTPATVDGAGGVIEGAAVGVPRVIQYQAIAAPVYIRKEGPADWGPTAPSYFPRKPSLTAGQHQFFAMPLAVADVTVIVPALTPPVYPSRLTRLHTLPQHLAHAQPPLVIPAEAVPDLIDAVFPDRLEPRRTAQHQAFAWGLATPPDYPVGSATAVYPRWFPLRASRAAYMQALAWHSTTPPDVQPGEFFFTSIFPRRLDRAPRMLPGYRAAPVYITDVTDPPPTLLPPPVYPRRLERRALYSTRGNIPSYGVGPIIPSEQFPEPPPTVCVTAPPTAGCWPPDDEHPPSVKPIGRAGRQRP